jgi:Tfp pilus assembly protein FimT
MKRTYGGLTLWEILAIIAIAIVVTWVSYPNVTALR